MTPAERFAAGMRHPLRATVMYPPAREIFARYRSSRDAVAIERACAAAGPRVGLYAHVPFCEQKCTYCDYATLPLGRFGAAALDRYVDGLCRELEAVSRALPADSRIAGFDVGGGTPAVLDERHFARLLETVISRFRLAGDFGVSTETTPTLAAREPQKWRALRRLGIERVSMGVQTAEAALLGLVNRRAQHADVAARGMAALRAAGFDWVNVDLMFALPGLSLERWLATVELAIALSPDVVTTYDTVYKGRGIARQADRECRLPEPSDYGAQYDAAWARLADAGYRARYGSVNFSRLDGRLGTSRYLESRIRDGSDYVGVGLYASSLVGDRWRFGLRGYRAWLDAATAGRLAAEDCYELPRAHVVAKFVLLTLSYGELDAERFAARFGEQLEDRFGEAIGWAMSENLLLAEPFGFAVAPGRFAELPGLRSLFVPAEALAALDRPLVPPSGERSPEGRAVDDGLRARWEERRLDA